MNPNVSGNYFRYPDDSGEELRWHHMTSREREFADLVQEILREGRVPGPTELNERMGRGRDNNLHGRLSKIRRAIFEGAGLIKDEQRGRWVLLPEDEE